MHHAVKRYILTHKVDDVKINPLSHVRRKRGWYDQGRRHYRAHVPNFLCGTTKYAGDESWKIAYGENTTYGPDIWAQYARDDMTEKDTEEARYGHYDYEASELDPEPGS